MQIDQTDLGYLSAEVDGPFDLIASIPDKNLVEVCAQR
jgi:hypothetical protein